MRRSTSELKQTIEAARSQPVADKVTAIARPRGDLADVVTAAFPEVTLRDLVGPQPLTEAVAKVLHEQRQRQALLDHGYTPAHRLLLEGPPGTGKTLTAAVIAHELSLPLLTNQIGQLAEQVPQRAVYLFDEFDALGGHRSGNDVGEARRILNSFLVFLEEASAESIVVAVTNHRSILDHALFRRFDMVIKYESWVRIGPSPPHGASGIYGAE